jgi:hypothetical protein
MEGWHKEWERKFLKRVRRDSKKPGISIDELEALRQDIWEIAHPGETMPARPQDVMAEAPNKHRLRLTKRDRDFARQVGIRTEQKQHDKLTPARADDASKGTSGDKTI